MARGIRATADQIIVTNGYRAALNLIIRGLKLEKCKAWLEEPGSSIARAALEIAGVEAVGIPVDSQGIVVERGVELARNAALVVVTPSQQAPMGMTLSRERRTALLAWAQSVKAWIVEDDHLGELQLDGRSVPALAADDEHSRVIHIGTFSRTISPHLVLGFIVMPITIAERLGNAAAYLAPAPNMLIQHSLTAFMAEGRFVRHLARMRRLYRLRRDALSAELAEFHCTYIGCLSLLITLPEGKSDTAICEEAYRCGISPAPLSSWFSNAAVAPRGLMLCVTNCRPDRLAGDTKVLRALLARHR
jgi:GntR family transcriptional regulator/MocR family aminotransferase